jgi:hypothetical protein
MAGSYPDAPSRRIAYDDDGTVVWGATSAGSGTFGQAVAFTAFTLPVAELNSTVKAELNDEDSVTVISRGGPGDPDNGYAWVWPEKRDIFGFFGHVLDDDAAYINEIDYSTNTKNGISGDFFPLTTDLQQPIGGDAVWSVEHSYREFINALDSTGTRSVRVRMQYNKTVGGAVDQAHVRAFHWYGVIANSANPDRFLIMDNDTGLEFDELQDWGDIPRGSVHDKDIYFLNNSDTLSASSNIVNFEAGFGDSDEWYTIRDNSSTAPAFSTQLSFAGPISPGARYPASTSVTIRLSVADDEDLGPHAARMRLDGSWA